MKAPVMQEKKVTFDNDIKRISLLRKNDKTIGILFLVLLAASFVAFLLLALTDEFTIYTSLPVMAVPFFVIGAIFYIVNRRFIALGVIAVLSLIAYLIMPDSVLFILYLLVCAEGVAMVVEVFQRLIFYEILSRIEQINVKEKTDIVDKLIMFFFNIPVDLDTRNLKIEADLSRNKLPIEDMVSCMIISLLFCMFLWIYLFLNPMFSFETEGVPIYTFTIILYISALVMPWTVFSTVNARIETDYRSFKLYDGFMSTFKRMFLPAFAAVLFLIFALYTGPENLYYILMSMAMIIVMTIFTSAMYFTSNELSMVNDILDKWGEFHPTEIYSGFDSVRRKSSLKDDIPGTPRRNPSECFSVDLKSRAR